MQTDWSQYGLELILSISFKINPFKMVKGFD